MGAEPRSKPSDSGYFNITLRGQYRTFSAKIRSEYFFLLHLKKVSSSYNYTQRYFPENWRLWRGHNLIFG